MALLPVKKREPVRSELTRLHDEMDDLISNFFGSWDTPLLRTGRWPALDVAENDNEYTIKAEVPGCKPEDIDISVHGSTLTITGEKKQEEEKKEKGYYHIERSYGSFRRDLNLGSEVEAAKIDATCKNGILTVKLPKSERAKPTKIKVKG